MTNIILILTLKTFFDFYTPPHLGSLKHTHTHTHAHTHTHTMRVGEEVCGHVHKPLAVRGHLPKHENWVFFDNISTVTYFGVKFSEKLRNRVPTMLSHFFLQKILK